MVKHPLIGKKINEKYAVLKLIGHGAYSPVFSVIDTESREKLAMKTLDKYLSESSLFEETLQQVIVNQGQVSGNSPDSVVKTIETGIIKDTDTGADGTPYIIMEKMDGSMRSYDLKLEQKLFCVAESTNALNAAHENSLLHLDYHPDQILLNIDGEDIQDVKVSDFGVSALMEDTGRYNGASDSPIKYPAFEQTRAGKKEHELSPKTDVYQVGATLLELTTGMDEPKPGYEKELDKFEDVPIELRELIKDCLELYPQDRPDISHVRYQLKKLIDE